MDWVPVIERQKNGNLHAHYVVALKWDVQTGFDWGEANFAYALQKARQFTSACAAWVRAANAAVNGELLREEWRFWREKTAKYGLGRTEIPPVRSSKEAIARYVGKYVSKHIGNRRMEDKGVRLLSVSKGVKVGSTAFAWYSVRSTLWRMKVRALAIYAGCFNLDQLKRQFGPRWAWVHYERIMSMPIAKYPTAVHARADGVSLPPDVPDDALDVEVAVRKCTPLTYPLSQWHSEAMKFLQMARRVFGLEPPPPKHSKPQARQVEMFPLLLV